MKRKFRGGLALTVLALVGLVPVQATPAAADPETLDVTLKGIPAPSETVARAAGTQQRLVATLSGAAAANRVVQFDRDGTLANGGEANCPIPTGAMSCEVRLSQAGTGKETIRAWVEDFDPTAIPPTQRQCGVPIPPTLPEDCDSAELRDETSTAGAGNEPEPDDTDVVEIDWYVSQLKLTGPVTVTPGSAVSITATLTAKGVSPVKNLVGNIDGEVIDGPNKDKVPTKADMDCTTTAAGTCTLTYTAGANAGVDEVHGWLDENHDPEPPPDTDSDGDETGDPFGSSSDYEGDDKERADEVATPGDDAEPDNTDNIKVNISTMAVLTIGPETQNKDTGTTAAITVSLTTGGTPTNNQKIAAAVLGGPNTGKVLTCTTGAGGTCDLAPALTSSAAGTDRVRATVDTDGNGQPNEADQTEDVGVGGGTAEPDTTAVAQVNWVAPTKPDDTDTKCTVAKAKLKKAKKALKKAKKSGDVDRIKKAKKKVKKLKKRKRRACA